MKPAIQHTTPFDIAPNGDILYGDEISPNTQPHPSEGWVAGSLSQEDRAMIAVSPRMIDLAARAGHLTRALDEMSATNNRDGYVKAAQSEKYRLAIEARYGDNTDGVAEGAAYNAMIGERRARYEFFAAHGLGGLALATKGTILTPDERVTRRALDDSWRSFRLAYGATGRRAVIKRQALSSALNKQTEFA